MSQFVIQCPSCGNPVKANTSPLSRKKIPCSCGYVIDVRADSLATRECPHCGNAFVFDPAKNKDAVCPVCHTSLKHNPAAGRLVDFSCKQCGATLSATQGTSVYECPLCGYSNSVQERFAVGAEKKQELASVIKFEGNSTALVWKSPIEDFRYGSQLIVHESQEAIFFKDGQALDLFGPGRYTLETQQLPIFDRVYKLPSGNEGAFHSEVYFINKATQMAVKWGTPDKLRFIDPLTGVPLQIGASGTLNLVVSDSRKLLVKLVGTMAGIAWESEEGFAKSLSESFRPFIANEIKTNLPRILCDEAIDILEIDVYLSLLSQKLREKVAPGFEEFGLAVPQFYLTNVVLPEEDPHFARIRELHTITLQTRIAQAEATVKTAQAQSQQLYRTAEEQSRAAIEAARREAVLQQQLTETEMLRREAERTIISAEAEARAVKLAGLAEAEVMKAQGFDQRDVLQAEVQKAYAQGIGNMGSGAPGGGGSVSGDVLGLGLGLAVAGAVAPQIGNVVQGLNTQQGASNQREERAPFPMNFWNCKCGQQGNNGNFCSNCGKKRGDGE